MKLYLKTKDYSVSKEDFELWYDEGTDMLITKPQPKSLTKYYQSESYISHTDANSSFTDKLYQLVKKYSLKRKVRLLGKYMGPNARLLDIGAGTADFLIEAKAKGWNIEGVEPNANAREKALSKGIHLKTDLEKIKGQQFDVITLWHVLEHLPDLENQISKITTLLKDTGILLIAVPNYKSHDAHHYGKFWAAFDVPRHLWHFSKTSIKKMFEKEDCTTFKIKPLIFDAYYVSLLSEHYRTGKQQYIRAFWRGFRSNLKAKRTKEYSSHIYLLKKSI